jgi:hypothetical protein
MIDLKQQRIDALRSQVISLKKVLEDIKKKEEEKELEEFRQIVRQLIVRVEKKA